MRRHPRYPVAGGMLRLLWDDGKQERILKATVLNVSATGVKLLVDERLPVRALVLCSDMKLGIYGSASIRYCNFTRRKYEIGLEFANGSGWREPQDSVDSRSRDVRTSVRTLR